jgi:hypothetical protein
MVVLVADVAAREDGAAASDGMAAETVAPANANVFNTSRLCITLVWTPPDVQGLFGVIVDR